MIFSINGTWQLSIRKKKQTQTLTSHHSPKSFSFIIDLNEKGKAIIILEGNIEEYLQGLGRKRFFKEDIKKH